jgi:hypothetical protein
MPLIDLKSDLTWKGKTPPGDAGPQDRLSRSVRDTVRISKYLASPNGALFIGKQIGLQLTNPNTENILGLPNFNPITNSNKQFTPVNLLANVAGAGLGIHVSRHGLLPLTELFNYEATVLRNRPDLINNNRLVRLKNELIDSKSILPKSKLVNRVLSITQQIQTKLGYTGKVINTLTGVTGPKSLLGVGTTTFRVAEKRYPAQGTQNYTIKTQYVSGEAGYLKSNTNDTNNNNRTNIDNWSLSPNARTDTQFSKIGEDYLDITVNKQIPDALDNPVQRTNAPIPKLNDYATVAYGRIPSRGRHNYTGTPNNFVLDNIDAADYKNLITGPAVDKKDPGFKDYATKNVQAAFGYLNYGAKNSKANGGDGNPSDYKWQGNNSGKSDIINFQIGSTKLRAYIDSISDSFSPSIDTEQPLGSPINAVRFTSIERSVSLSFKMAVLAQTDLKLIYRKMKELQSYASYSTQAGNAFTLRTIDIIIGDLYNFKGYVESVSFDWDSEMPWEITSTIGQVPLYCNASIDFKYIVPRAGFKIVD